MYLGSVPLSYTNDLTIYDIGRSVDEMIHIDAVLERSYLIFHESGLTPKIEPVISILLRGINCVVNIRVILAT